MYGKWLGLWQSGQCVVYGGTDSTAVTVLNTWLVQIYAIAIKGMCMGECLLKELKFFLWYLFWLPAE